MPESTNPYATTVSYGSESVYSLSSSDAETTRRRFLNHEASVKSVGFLYLLGGSLGVVCGVAYIALGFAASVASTSTPAGDPNSSQLASVASAIVLIVLGVAVLALAVVQIWAGWGCRRLNRPARIAATIIAAFGLLVIPLGTLISVYILYLLHSEKGNVVFSDQYKQVIAETPHIRYKSSIIVRILVVILLLIIGAGLMSAIVISL